MLFVPSTLLLFKSGVCLPLNKRNELNVKNQKSIREKTNLSVDKFKNFFLEKKTKKAQKVHHLHDS